ncbi:hypothetical protein MMC29_000892 [Sticta canariensis]|nr:hypothetical protein [Sticta canariensis]
MFVPLSIFAICVIIYLVWLGLYRLYWSPIASFPGSKLTAVSGWYETYFDVFKGGQFTFQVQKWHQQYGPIIRINPWEIHISDPEFYDVVYSSNTRFEKIERFKYRFGGPTGVQATVEHDIHHRRRVALNPYFSKRQIVDFSGQIQTCAERLCQRLANEYRGTSRVVTLNNVWAAFSTDIIILYAFAFSYDFIEYPDFVAPFTTSLIEMTKFTHFAGHFPWLLTFLQSVPDAVLGVVNPAMRPVFQFQNEVKHQIIRIKNGENRAHINVAHKTVFNSLLESGLPPEELSIIRLQQEAAGIIGAGIETIKASLSLACFHLLSNRDLYQQLRQELESAFPDLANPLTLSELERLPYLSAVINESLRLSYGVAQRLPRVSPTAPIQYGNWTIPAGVPFSMSSYLMHHDESIFPNSHTFDPSRWLHNPKVGGDKPLMRYLVAFSKGSRMCVGLNLAWAELYIGLANVIRRLDLELFDTGHEAIVMASEFLVPKPKEGTKGVRVFVK